MNRGAASFLPIGAASTASKHHTRCGQKFGTASLLLPSAHSSRRYSGGARTYTDCTTSTMRPPSLLTRRLFRAIIANQPYHSAACPLRTATARKTKSTATYALFQRRSLFGLAIGSTRQDLANLKPTPKNIEVALGKLADYVQAKKSLSRPPSNDELVAAVRFLVTNVEERHRPMTRNQVFLVTETVRHLVDQGVELGGEDSKSLTHADILAILSALCVPITKRPSARSDAIALADLVHPKKDLSDRPEENYEPWEELQSAYAAVLASSGMAEEAYALVKPIETHVQDHVWVHVLQGMASDANQEQFESYVQGLAGTRTEPFFSDLVHHLANVNELDKARSVIETAQVNLPDRLFPEAMIGFLRSCLRHGRPELAQELLKLLHERDRMPEVDVGSVGAYLACDVAAGADTGKIHDALTKYVEEGVEVTMADFNAIVHYAYLKQDPDLADQYIQMAQVFGAVPDAETYALRLDYEIGIADLNAARGTFEGLSVQDVPTARVDVPVLNRYVARLASAPDSDPHLIMRVVDRILETDAELDAEALAALSSTFLRTGELQEALGLLRYRVDSLSGADREKIAAVFKTFITDLSVKDQRAFNAYELFRHAFPETEPAARLPLMHSFFDRKRSDLACLVFGHMRQADDIEARPDDEAYAQCFYGIARCRDVDGLQMVYNMLKMDKYVDQTTKVHNAMMAAYTACQTPFTAIIDHYWKILDSREGPTLSSFKLALRACETWIGAGGEEARRIMALMQKWDMVITKEIYDCYIGALAGQSQFENCIELIECMEQDIGEAPDATTIGTFYNAIPWQYRKDEVEAWARQVYPELWEELVSYGDEIDEEWEVRYFNINRDIEVDDELLFGEGRYSPLLAVQSALGLPEPEHARA